MSKMENSTIIKKEQKQKSFLKTARKNGQERMKRKVDMMTSVKVEHSACLGYSDMIKKGRKKNATCREQLKLYFIFVKLKYAENEEVDIFSGLKKFFVTNGMSLTFFWTSQHFFTKIQYTLKHIDGYKVRNFDSTKNCKNLNFKNYIQ